ncbi:MAG: dephospho-CoA kinase [Neomegalonema sp.]|nr:dephospho-CoA kinase [Neomegalonema sp.]
MIRIGLTGSIGMGKSTTSKLFKDLGGAVHDADAAVAALYRADGEGAQVIGALAPDALLDGAVDRDRLRAAVLADPTLLAKLEDAIHPLVTADRERFAAQQQAAGKPFVVFDIPLLFETGAETACDVVVVVSTSPEIQRQRVLARPTMTEVALDKILSRQMPDGEKRARADYVVDTSIDIADAKRQVVEILSDLERRFGRPLQGV